MTIAVACCLADGIIMGADSAITITGVLETPEGRHAGVLKVYNDADKLFSLHDLPVGIVTFGLASLGKRTVQSYIREFEHSNKESNMESWSIEKLSRELWRFFETRYREELGKTVALDSGIPYSEVEPAELPILGFMVGGFGPEEHLPELWEVIINSREEDKGVTQKREPGNFGSDWGGQIEGVIRFHKGFSFPGLQEIITAILKHHNLEMTSSLNEEIIQIIRSVEYMIPWDGMPLQQGVDYVKFCLDIMINQTKFVVGAPTCGGNVRIAVIRQNEGFRSVADNNFEVRRI
ncbi:MAG: hypothetical protein KBG20_17870 [Caldilineaceae bacterium]|nr:hypothetical protein [Caldilineaceae bacterium]MBP8109609.1 hypothetical protein [Caldilineaceae bacterium]MBP8124501.1 hypothetical protein [Caldilineaceae bacterium]MBP9074178.1 hypothetical protein [Caldilineaceae bacterium]